MFLAAFESSRRCRDLSFDERRSLFGNHSLSFGSGQNLANLAASISPLLVEDTYSATAP